ncbi:MAG TPA: glycosyl hydrolase family 18 protein [Spirochaetota bacterium]|nr:glycosyl hydrolase family 18 protein [Spirochaetota bacterium]HPC41185.1 glycosyl hydrolase family 18 protein [Spirochaetota bacterium]HPL17126.1 glycosyl hydrolase family 18 protein [Spirochaetota bacterium]HQF07105.1 glycosyl hydrolase family 18 protein [Spirochaetota bacterium]HQH95842.1 glycosyl hydrolase family 18 protein [Spirochaetota bacterium]
MKHLVTTAAVVIVAASIAQCSRETRKEEAGRPPCEFMEVWAYLMKGEELKITGSEPLTDLLYFGCSVNRDGRLRGSTAAPKLPFAGPLPRIHLVVFSLADPALLRSCLDNKGTAREALIGDIAAAANNFAGVQIDFESLHPEDGRAYLDFLAELKKRIPAKTLSVAVPVRLNAVARTAYDYEAIAGIVDKVFIMAYDQHWETSKAGPVSSLSWCDSAAGFATLYIPREKLVMGIPLYGRAWQGKKINRAVTYRQAVELAKQSGEKPSRSPDRGPTFEYTEEVRVRVYYEDIASIHAKLRLYKSYNIPSVAFWRIGQGPRELWNTIGIGVR